MAWNPYRAKAENEAGQHFFATWSVRKKLLCALIPGILLLLGITGYVTNWFSTRYLAQALHRTAQANNLAQVHELEQTLDSLRLDLLALAGQHSGREAMERALAGWNLHRPGAVRELVYVGENAADSLLLLNLGQEHAEIRPEQFVFIQNSPIALALKTRGLKAGHVSLSELTETVYPPSAFPEKPRALSFVVYRMITPVIDAQGVPRGHLLVSVDATALRNILSTYNSAKSPLHSFQRTSENRFSFLFDDQGWMLFQSDNIEELDKDLGVEGARLGMTGEYGMPGFDKAFRPSPRHESYWRMVVTVQGGGQGVEDASSYSGLTDTVSSQHFLVYAPLRFRSSPDKDPEVVAGVAFVDRSRLTDVAEFRHLDVMVVITIVAIGLAILLVSFASNLITKPLLMLASDICSMFEESSPRAIELRSVDKESLQLQQALNRLILSLQDKQEQLRRRDEHILQVQQRQKVSFDEEIPPSLGWRLVGEIPDLIGQSAAIAQLQALIRKAAGTDADVLILGETGTGKELTAEAVHKFSARSDKPFISINCGGLDENLLMDALFGHVKGAFTEARNDRKGAFFASDGGTLFLDEIGTASDKVQKALLRALSERKVRPLGSDREVPFNVRVIAATNEDLQELVQRGSFREDLYYRLKVITIHTPPLRQRKEDIPLLARHFLQEMAAPAQRGELGLSRGALDRLMEHSWPGNVRELKNCLIRALAFSDGTLLFSEDLVFDVGGAAPGQEPGSPPPNRRAREPLSESQPAQPLQPAPEGPAQPRRKEARERAPRAPESSPRQRVALDLAKGKGAFSRLDYQAALGAGVSQRTAQYDLTDMVRRGLLRKQGRGPATLYSAGLRE